MTLELYKVWRNRIREKLDGAENVAVGAGL